MQNLKTKSMKHVYTETKKNSCKKSEQKSFI